MEWFLYMTSLVYMFQYNELNSKAGTNTELNITAVAATAIFIAWVIFVLYLRRLVIIRRFPFSSGPLPPLNK